MLILGRGNGKPIQSREQILEIEDERYIKVECPDCGHKIRLLAILCNDRVYEVQCSKCKIDYKIKTNVKVQVIAEVEKC